MLQKSHSQPPSGCINNQKPAVKSWEFQLHKPQLNWVYRISEPSTLLRHRRSPPWWNFWRLGWNGKARPGRWKFPIRDRKAGVGGAALSAYIYIHKCRCIYICQNNADFLSVNGCKYDKYDMTICDSDIPQPDLWAFSSKWLSYRPYQTWHSISLESRGWNTGAFCRLIIRRVFVQVNHGKPIGLLDRVAWAWPH